MPRHPRLSASTARRCALLRLAPVWLLVFAPGLAVVAVAAQVFQLMASSSRETLLSGRSGSLRVAGGSEAVLATHPHDGGQ
jgi:hypothetical protein